MNRDVHRTEPSHGEAANRPVAGCGNRAIFLIDIAYQVKSHEILHELLLIKAVAPLTGLSAPSIAIGKNHDQFRYLFIPYKGIGRPNCFASPDPVVFAAWRTMQQVEGGISPILVCRIPIGWWDVYQERPALPTECRADHTISD